MKKMHVALLLVLAACVGVGTAATLVGHMGVHIEPPGYVASDEAPNDADSQ